MEPKTSSKQRGLRMAMQVAALSVGAGAAAMALAASEAKADDAPRAAAAALDAPAGQGATAGPEPLRTTGWSCWAPTSRGPLAPPALPAEDFEALLAEVPA